jgi:serine/threonine protein kinase
MICGKPAFQSNSQASLIAAILKEEPAPLASLEPVTPPALDRLVRKCLAKDPDARWQTAADLRDELEWNAQTGSQAATPPPVRRRWTSWLPAVAALVLAVVAGVFWQASRTPALPN